MKRLFYIILIAVAGLGVLITSCSEDFMEKNPPGVLSEAVLASVDGVEALLIGAYAEIDGNAGWSAGAMWSSTTTNWVFGDVYADDAYKGTDVGDQPAINPIERYEHDPQNGYFNTKWLAMYDGVSRCNDVLRVLAEAVDNGSVEQSLATQITAETRFLRAFYHLELIKLFDYIVYVDETAETDLIPNNPASSTGDGNAQWGNLEGDGDIPWEQVEADFQFAYDNLPVDPRNGQVGRATKYAASGFLAKTLMFQNKYSQALTLMNEIINSGKYSLPDNFHDNFRIAGDNNSESIFQVQNSVNDGSGSGYNGNYGDILNFPYTGGPGECCGFYQPSLNLVNAYKTENGLPYLEAFGLDFNAAGDDVNNDMGIASADPFTEDTRPLDPRLDWTVGRRGIPYLDWGDHPGGDWIRNQNNGGPYAPKKNVFYQAEQGSGSHAGGWGGGLSANNHSLLRYAEVLLLAAEAEVEGGNLDRARSLVNEVRGRIADHPETWVKDPDGADAANYVISRYPNGGPNDPFQTQAGAREAVQFEKRLELAMEGHRYWDLKRWGGTKDHLNEYVTEEAAKIPLPNIVGAQFNDRDIRFPIPQSAIDRSEQTLSQNPGY